MQAKNGILAIRGLIATKTEAVHGDRWRGFGLVVFEAKTSKMHMI
jgi:hypothetical protein